MLLGIFGVILFKVFASFINSFLYCINRFIQDELFSHLLFETLKKGKIASKEQAVGLRNKLQTDNPAQVKPAAVGLSCARYLFRTRSLLMFA